MNIYLRYFDDECVVHSVEEALQFIQGIPDFNITPVFEADFKHFAESPQPFPKRYKVRPRVYFIAIKTTAESLDAFKANAKEATEQPIQPLQQRPKESQQSRLSEERPGWYEVVLNFKRVVTSPRTGKADYRDTIFAARLKAISPQDSYNRVIDHLRTRSDVDRRSQFPSIKGKNFQYTYLGIKPFSEINI